MVGSVSLYCVGYMLHHCGPATNAPNCEWKKKQRESEDNTNIERREGGRQRERERKRERERERLYTPFIHIV